MNRFKLLHYLAMKLWNNNLNRRYAWDSYGLSQIIIRLQISISYTSAYGWVNLGCYDKQYSYYLFTFYLSLKVASLRQKFSFAPDGLAGNMQEAVDASVFSSTVQQFWKSNKEKKVMVLDPSNLESTRPWLVLKQARKFGLMKYKPRSNLIWLIFHKP